VDTSKLDAGVITPEIMVFPVAELLDSLAREYQQVATSEGLTLDYVPSRAIVTSDISLLGRVVRNFLSNAVRYTPKGRLLLGCRRRRDGVEIQVCDTGIGIDSAEREAIFQEFRRLNVSGRGERGLGLGLSIADKVARILNHPLRVDSQPGQGSIFSIVLPYAQRAPENIPQSLGRTLNETTPMCLAGQRVWVVDNDADTCHAMKTLLTRWQCHVVVAESESALGRQVDLDREPTDVLIVDYHLDNEDTGLALAERVNARRETPVPVMVITANHSAELRHRLHQLGYQLLLKPVRPLKLRMGLAQAITVRAEEQKRLDA